MDQGIYDNGLSKKQLARRMLLLGYVTYIVRKETHLSVKQVQTIRAELKHEGRKFGSKSRTLRSGATIINNSHIKMQASMMMQLYRNIGGDGVLRTVKLSALEQAHGMYCALCTETGSIEEREPDLDLSDCWCLATELWEGSAMFEQCPDCDTTYFTSVNQRTDVQCPYCLQRSRSAANKGNVWIDEPLDEPTQNARHQAHRNANS